MHPMKQTESHHTQRWPLVAGMILVLLLGAALRLHRLPELPLGLHYDEAANGILAGEIARGLKTPIFIPSYTGKEVLFFYWTALWMRILGPTPLALRLSAALTGVLTIAATAWMVRELLPDRSDRQRVALLSATFVATSFWHLLLSRYGFRAITQPLMQALTVAALWRGLRNRRIGWIVIGGLFCGLTAYTYLAARAFPIPLTAALMVMLLADRQNRTAHTGRLALFVSVAALVLAPLAIYWLTHPGSFMTRAEQVAAGSWSAAWEGILDCLKMFFIRGDPYIRFNIPLRPLFGPLTAGLALVGLGTLVSGRRIPLGSCILLIATLPVMILPSALAAGEITPSNLRTVGLLPFIYVLPALGLSTVWGWVTKKRLRPHSRRAVAIRSALFMAFVSILAASGAAAYFGDWAISPALHAEADGDVAAIARALNRSDLSGLTPYVASKHYEHPTLAFLSERYGKVQRIVDGRTVVFPPHGEALLMIPRSIGEDLMWVETLLPPEAPQADGDPAFHAFRFNREPIPQPEIDVGANVSHVVRLLGYTVTAPPRSGQQVELAVWWEVLNPPPHGDYRPIARLVDPWGGLWGETMPFHYVAREWQVGEVIIDHLSLPIEPGAPPGEYVVRLGFYSAEADTRLSVLDPDGSYAGTTVELPVSIARAAEPPAVEKLALQQRIDSPLDGLTLRGANLNRRQARPGERLSLTLFWQAEASPLPDREVILRLGPMALYAGAPVHGTYPTTQWRQGEIVADRYDPRLPREAPPGTYDLTVTVGERTVELGEVTVENIERAFEPPPIVHPIEASLDSRVALLGYDVNAQTVAPGEALRLTLYWRALAEMETGYTVFVHLEAPNDSMTAQQDHPPVDGTYPTDLWLTGEVVTDSYELSIPADAPPGDHRLTVGMYVARTGERLAVDGSAQETIPLQPITIEGP